MMLSLYDGRKRVSKKRSGRYMTDREIKAFLAYEISHKISSGMRGLVRQMVWEVGKRAKGTDNEKGA